MNYSYEPIYAALQAAGIDPPDQPTSDQIDIIVEAAFAQLDIESEYEAWQQAGDDDGPDIYAGAPRIVPPGVLVDQTYGYADIPDGWVPVQADDSSQEGRSISDQIAAARLSAAWGTEDRYFSTGTDEPGDWAVRLP